MSGYIKCSMNANFNIINFLVMDASNYNTQQTMGKCGRGPVAADFRQWRTDGFLEQDIQADAKEQAILSQRVYVEQGVI